MRFCITLLVFAWSSVASGFGFSRWKPKNGSITASSPDRIDLDKLDQRISSIENKIVSVGDDVRKVSNGVGTIMEDAQIAGSSWKNLNKHFSSLEEAVHLANTESSSTKLQVFETRKWQEAFDKDHGRFSHDVFQKLDTLSRNLESLSESVARVHHLLAIRPMSGVPVPAPGGPPPPPPLPMNNQNLPPIRERSASSQSRQSRVENLGGYNAVLEEIKEGSPLTKLRKTNRYSVNLSGSGSSNTESGMSTDSD